MHPVEITDLVAGYGRRKVLDGVDLCVPAGSVTALLGENGAGKSTLLRVLAGDLRARTGTVRVAGLDPGRSRRSLVRSIGYVPERTDLPRWMRLSDHFALLATCYPSWDHEEAGRWLAHFGLEDSTLYRDLSKGQRALENLTAALAHRPPVLLLDEPFSGLDPLARRKVFQGVLGALRDEGRAILLVSHSMADVVRCTDRLAILRAGRIVLHGDLEEVLRATVKLRVELREPCVDWTPPGSPLVEHAGNDRVLLYCSFDESTEASLHGDPAVLRYERLPRDLDDVFAAQMQEEVPA